MSEVAIGASREGDGAFRRATMLLIVAIGTLAFIATRNAVIGKITIR